MQIQHKANLASFAKLDSFHLSLYDSLSGEIFESLWLFFLIRSSSWKLFHPSLPLHSSSPSSPHQNSSTGILLVVFLGNLLFRTEPSTFCCFYNYFHVLALFCNLWELHRIIAELILCYSSACMSFFKVQHISPFSCGKRFAPYY